MYEDALSTLDPALETCSAVEPEQALGVGGWVLKTTDATTAARKE